MYDLSKQKHIRTVGDLIDALQEYTDIREQPISINGVEKDDSSIDGLFLNVDMIDDDTGCIDCLTLDQHKRAVN